MNEQQTAISPLVADLISASLTQTHAVTDQVIDSMTTQLDIANATIHAIRDAVLWLYDGPHMPSQNAVISALYPTAEAVGRYREGAS